MRLLRLSSKSVTGTVLAGALVLASAGPAIAYTVYQLEPDYYAIKCKDGTLHSYSGSASGLSTVGPALCEGHGGIADPGGSGAGSVQVKPAVKKPVPDNGSIPEAKELDKASPKLMK